MAIKSGMLAAETIFDALKSGDTSAKTLSAFPQKVEQSYIGKEICAGPQFPPSRFSTACIGGLFHTGLQFVTGGRGLIDPMRHHCGLQALSQDQWPMRPRRERFKGDGKLTFDRLTDVYHSGTRHEEDQPCHLIVHDSTCAPRKCTVEYGNPCQYFCPAAVYEMVKEHGAFKLKINAANCVHCKTCDIADPYQIIDWVVPEGGGGPNYEGM